MAPFLVLLVLQFIVKEVALISFCNDCGTTSMSPDVYIPIEMKMWKGSFELWNFKLWSVVTNEKVVHILYRINFWHPLFCAN